MWKARLSELEFDERELAEIGFETGAFVLSPTVELVHLGFKPGALSRADLFDHSCEAPGSDVVKLSSTKAWIVSRSTLGALKTP